jgi:inosine-uridine nucleoside N-ribohydrolase
MKKIALILSVAAAIMAGCKDDRVNLIMETDIGNDIDDAIAMDLIYKNIDAKRVNLLGVCINKEGYKTGEFVDILNTWYGHPDVPIGIIRDGATCDEVRFNYTRKVVEMTGEDGSPTFKRTLNEYDNLPEAPVLYRKLLAKAKDHSVVIASVGFSTNLARLLETPADKYSKLTGKELVAKKVKLLSTMAGSFDRTGRHEYNVVKDIPAAKKVFEEWPTPLVTSPWEVGAEIRYPARSIDNDFGWSDGPNPLVEAYYHYQPRPYNSPTWDPTAVLYAIEGGEWFTVSEPGFIKVTDEGETVFTPNPEGNRRYLMVDQIQQEAIMAHFIDIVSKVPANHR